MVDQWKRFPASLLLAGAFGVAGPLLLVLASGWAVWLGGGLVVMAIGLGTWAWVAFRDGEQRLTESEARFRLLAEHAHDLICLHGPDGCYRWVSPSAERILGHPSTALIGQHPRDFLHPTDQTLAGPGLPATPVRYRHRRGDGTWIWLECTIHPILGSDGRPTSYHSVARDVTRQQADAESLQQAHRSVAMAERMAAIGTLAGGVAHEFNNLNAVILGNVEMALTTSDLPPEIRRRLGLVMEAVDRERGIVDALLTFSRSERGPGKVIDVGSIVSTTLALAQRTLRQRQITLGLDLATEPLFACVPSGALGQVLLNLLLNACDAVDRRDDPRVWISLRRSGANALLTVRDNGLGIRPEDLPKVFQPFFSTKGEHAPPDAGQSWLKGSGLGLSVCQTLVEQLAGTITVESAPDAGATFSVLLPLAEAPGLVPEAIAKPTPCARILVVDDEPEIRQLLAEHLAAAGHVTVQAEDGRHALDHLAREDVDLVMLNWSMPRVDGQAFLEHLEMHPERRWPPIVVVSGWTGGGSGIDRWQREIVGELRKPFSLEQVRSTVHSALLGEIPDRPRRRTDSSQG